jgi:hypothetical protein
MKHPLAGISAIVMAAVTSAIAFEGSVWHTPSILTIVLGAALATIIIIHWAVTKREFARVDDTIRRAITERLVLADRIAALEGIVKERIHRFTKMDIAMRFLDERSIVLMECDVDHEKRLDRVEAQLHVAHDKAIARLALRGTLFQNLNRQVEEELGKSGALPEVKKDVP